MPGEANPNCTTSYALSLGLNQIQLPLSSINVSLQVGDLVFVSNSNTVINNIDVSFVAPSYVGEVIAIDLNSITIEFDNCNTCSCAPESGDYLMFAKNKAVNTSGLKGYYLEAEFQNNSKIHAELFSVGTEVTESSK